MADTHVRTALRIAGVSFVYDDGPVVYRFADPARGEQRRPVASVPAISLLFEDEVEYARVGTALDREYALHVTSATSAPRGVTVRALAAEGADGGFHSCAAWRSSRSGARRSCST